MNQQQLGEQKAKAQWVKASERRPSEVGHYACRIKRDDGLYDYKELYAENSGQDISIEGEWIEVGNYAYSRLEWLEEGGMQGEGERLRECSNARKNEILRLREALDEMAEELEKKTESASMWAKKAMEAGLERNQLSAEVERLKGERDSLRIAAEALLNGLSKEHSGGKAIPRSIHVILKIKALKEVLPPKPQTEHE